MWPFTKFNVKKRHILVVTDAFTKYNKLYAVTATSTKEVINCLNKYFEYYGRPRQIISDRGSCFMSHEYAEHMIKNNIEFHRVATGSPQANGQVEIMNRIMQPMLGKLSESHRQMNWSHLLPEVEFAMNNHVSSSTKFTPSMVLFGVRQRGPRADILTEYLQNKNDSISVINRDLNKIREQADQCIKKSQKRNEIQYAKRSVLPPKYQIGDYVVIKNNDTSIGVNKKLAPKYKGPYKILKILSNDRYLISDIETHQVSQIPYNGILEAAHIKLWKTALKEIVSSVYH